MAGEGAAQALVTREARQRGGLGGVVPGVQQGLGQVEADQLHVPAGRGVQFGAEHAGQVAGADPDPRGERVQAVVGGRIGLDGVLHHPEDRCLRRRSLERGGELRLPAGPLHVHHQRTGHLPGQVRAVVVLDQGEREIDARGDTGRGVGGAVLDEDGVGFHPGGRAAAGQRGGVLPVRRRALALQQSGRAQHEGAGADRGHPPRPVRERPRGRAESGVDGGLRQHVAADHEHGVVGRAGSGVAVGRHPQPDGGVHRLPAHRDDTQPVVRAVPVGLAEHLRRPGQVEHLHAVEHQDAHAVCPRRHVPSALPLARRLPRCLGHIAAPGQTAADPPSRSTTTMAMSSSSRPPVCACRSVVILCSSCSGRWSAQEAARSASG